MKSSESTFFWPTPSRSWILGLSCPEAQTLLSVVLWGGLQLSHPPAVEGSTPLSPRPLLPSLLKSIGSFLLKVFLETTSVYWTCSVFDTLIVFAYMKWFLKMKIEYLSYPFIASYDKCLWPGCVQGWMWHLDSTGQNTNVFSQWKGSTSCQELRAGLINMLVSSC